MQEARGRTVQAALEAGLKELGVENIEGVPVSEWISKRLVLELQDVLIGMENHNPASAAQTQARIEQILKKFSGLK